MIKKIIFVSDFFTEQLTGGAELTFEALIESCIFSHIKVNSKQLTKTFINDNKDNYWIFGNTHTLNDELLFYISKNLNYSTIQFDYKFCKYRLPELHEEKGEDPCDCSSSRHGKIYSIFLAKSNSIWWMSKEQRDIHFSHFPYLEKTENHVLSSVFSDSNLKFFEEHEKQDKNNKYIILNSNSWVKGVQKSIEYAEKNKLDYDLVEKLTHDQLLRTLSEYSGLIFLPQGKDTCPRITIEAKLLDCELILNDNVQHKDEEWFENKDKIIEHLKESKKLFWKYFEDLFLNSLEGDEDIHFKLVVTCRNAEDTIVKTINSIKEQTYSNFECIISDDYSTDKTCSIIEREIDGDSRFKLVKNDKQSFPCKNTEIAIDSSTDIKDDDVIFVLGGDDWLPSRIVLSRLAYHYKLNDCWCTYGSWWTQNKEMTPFYMQQYRADIVKLNLFRSSPWVASSPRTFKYFLWDKIDKEDLTDVDGEYYKCATDFAYFIPILEMAGNRSLYINDILYTYNRETPMNMDKIYPGKQHENELKIRKRKRYSPLNSNYPNWSIACISYNDAKYLQGFLNSCLGQEGLKDIFVVDHRSDDNTHDVLERMKDKCSEHGIELNSVRCEQDFSANFTMADLRLMSVKGCKQELVSIQDADNLLGPNMPELVRAASIVLNKDRKKYLFGVSYPVPVVYDGIEIHNKKVVNHGRCIMHNPIPRILLKSRTDCYQDGRYYRFKDIHAPNGENDSLVVRMPYAASTNISLSFRDKERQKLRSVMGDYFEKSTSGEVDKGYLDSFKDGDLGKGEVFDIDGMENPIFSIVDEEYNCQ